MAKKSFILQGFTNKTHLASVRHLFEIPDIQTALLSVAFVREGGVQQIEAELRANSAKVTVFAGINNDITSYQGLALLHDIGVCLNTVNTGSRSIIFHPKIYFVRGSTSARLVIGSANLTLGGLNNNIEAGMLIELNLSNTEDKAVADEIETLFASITTDHPLNVVRVTTSAHLDALLTNAYITDESVIIAPRPRTQNIGTSTNSGNVPMMKLKVATIFANRKSFNQAAVSQKTATNLALPYASAVAQNYYLVWESKPLLRRTLNIPKPASITSSSNTSGKKKRTNPTGSSTLGKGLSKQIDPVTYFRNDVFGHLQWSSYKNKAENPAEQVDLEFELVIIGVNMGIFNLTLRHSLTRVQAANKDSNVPTEISWNTAKTHIQKEELLGRTMRIYRSATTPPRFQIEID